LVGAQNEGDREMTETLLRLAMVFSSLSILGFGGGKGIIPQMHDYAVDQFHWVTSDQFAQFYTIGRVVPGPTTIFSALIGYSAAGFIGAAVTTAAMFLPSSALMMLAGALWKRFSASPWKAVVSTGLAPVVIGLVWSSVFTIGRGALQGAAGLVIALIVTVLMLRTKMSATLLIALGAAGGAVLLR
jgi:chromate transporter